MIRVEPRTTWNGFPFREFANSFQDPRGHLLPAFAHSVFFCLLHSNLDGFLDGFANGMIFFWNRRRKKNTAPHSKLFLDTYNTPRSVEVAHGRRHKRVLMIFAASVGLSTLQGLWCVGESVNCLIHSGVCTHPEAAVGSVERGEVIGLTIGHNWDPQCFLRWPISLAPDANDLQD